MKKVYSEPTIVGKELTHEDIILASAGESGSTINDTDNVIGWWSNGGSEL